MFLSYGVFLSPQFLLRAFARDSGTLARVTQRRQGTERITAFAMAGLSPLPMAGMWMVDATCPATPTIRDPTSRCTLSL